MRSVFIALLLAGVATPALAQDGRVHDRFGRHGQDSNQQGDSSQSDAKPQRPQRNAEPRRETMPASEPNEVRSGMGRQHSYSGAGAAVEQGAMRSASGQARRSQQVPPAVQQVEEHHNVEAKVIHAPQGRSGDVGEHRTGAGRFHTPGEQATTSHSNIEERNLRRAPGTREQQGGGLVQQKTATPHVFRPAERRISRTPIRGTEPPAPHTATSRAAHPTRQWTTHWRNDHRYDWQNWRRHHHSSFHLGYYYDPFGWDYMRYGVGWRLWPSYYRNSFWLNDPWQYRLPPAYGPFRWIRYYDDALLVNIYTGEVVDVVYDFFW